jgi:FKBP-type peptidyl-prolyl cis-trans isomerase FklB
LLLFCLSCSSENEVYDAYANWPVRNAVWYAQIADSARTAINEAKTLYGDAWEDHCDWRMMKALTKSPIYQSGLTSDSVCAHIIYRGTGDRAPLVTDSVRVSFRGWLMPIQNELGQQQEIVFTQTYYGDYDAATTAPQKASVSSFAAGFSTALQYMVEGDDWMVYIPSSLFYGATANGIIPAYSAVRFRLQLMGVYPQGQVVPEW